MCEYCERSYSETEYDVLQTVCECGHLITSQSHVLPVRRRLSKKQSAPVGFQMTFPRVDFLFQTGGKLPKPAQIGNPIAEPNSGLAPTLNLTLVADGAGRRIRYRRKSTPTCTSPRSQLFPASLAESGNVTKGSVLPNAKVENGLATPISLKKRGIGHIDETRKEVHIKKPRRSLPWSLCAGGA